jgi:hypothetical protein
MFKGFILWMLGITLWYHRSTLAFWYHWLIRGHANSGGSLASRIWLNYGDPR